MAEELLKKKLSIEERKYADAVGLQDAVPCIIRFERKVSVLKSAAKKFESLGDYKDAKERSAACFELARQAGEQGYFEALKKGMSLEEKAVRKSDYVAAIEEYRRAMKSKKHRENAQKHIQICRNQIKKIKTKEVWKHRIIAFVILAICAIVTWKTQAYVYVMKLFK